MNKENTAIRLKQILEERNLKQVDVINMSKPLCTQYGIRLEKNDLSQYLSGKTEPGQNKLFILAKTLNVNEAWLMGFDVPRDRTDSEKTAPQTQDEPTPEEIQFLLEEMRAGRGSKEASILYYGGKPKPSDEKMQEIEKAIDRRNNLQSMAEKTAELILDGESPAMLVSYINDKWEQIPLTEDELKAIRILLQK